MKASNTALTLDRLKAVVSYDKRTGHFKWVQRGYNRVVGARAGSATSDGYWRVRIDYVPYKAHRLAWLYVYGSWPERPLVHIDGDRQNNRIANLKLRD